MRDAAHITEFVVVRLTVPALPHKIRKQLAGLVLIHIGEGRDRGVRQPRHRRRVTIGGWDPVGGNTVLNIPRAVERESAALRRLRLCGQRPDCRAAKDHAENCAPCFHRVAPCTDTLSPVGFAPSRQPELCTAPCFSLISIATDHIRRQGRGQKRVHAMTLKQRVGAANGGELTERRETN